MKNVNFLLFLFAFFFLNSCSSLMKGMLQNDPDFKKNADKYLISHPVGIHPSSKALIKIPSKPPIFIIEDGRTNDIYEMKVKWLKDTKKDGYIDKPNMKKGDVARERDFNAHKIFISNPIDDKNYEIIGTTATFRSLKKLSGKSTVGTSTMSYPIKFSIFEQGKDVGKIIVYGPSFPPQPQKIDVSIHDRLVSIKYQVIFSKSKFAFEFENELIAFFDIKPAKFITTKMKVNAYIKSGLTKDFIADIFTLYIIADIMIGVQKIPHI